MRRISPSTFERGTYGGWTDMPFTGNYIGGVPGFWRTGIQGDQWCLVDPEGYIFNLTSAYATKIDLASTHLDIFQDQTMNERVGRKVGANTVWGPLNCRMMLDIGLTTVGYASVATQPWEQSVFRIPGYQNARPAFYARGNEGGRIPGGVNASIKNIIVGNATYMETYSTNRGIADFFDPGFTTWIETFSAPSIVDTLWTVGYGADDTDWMVGFGAGPDFPRTSTVNANQHLGFIALLCKPKQVTGTNVVAGGTITYTDQTVYTKQALADFLQDRYGTIGALNTNWGTSGYYTTFGQSGPGDTWGTGTGLLDEDGRHTTWIGTRNAPTGEWPAANATLKADLDDFLYEIAKQYYSVTYTAIKVNAHPNLLFMGPTTIGTHGSPPRAQIIKAAAEYCDMIGFGVGNADPDIFQDEVDFMVASMEGNPKPIMTWTGKVCNPDSAMRHVIFPSNSVLPEFVSMKERSHWYMQRTVERMGFMAVSTGQNHQIGTNVWEYVDNWGEDANWGIKTMADNLYDQNCWATVRQEDMTWSGACNYDMGTQPRRDPWGYSYYPENVPAGNQFGGDFVWSMARALEQVKAQMLVNMAVLPDVALDMSLQTGSHSVVVYFGHANILWETSITVNLKNAGGSIVDTVTSSSGYANRTATFGGSGQTVMTPSTAYRVEVTADGFQDQGQDLTTLATGVGTAVIGIYLKPSTLTPTADRVTINYGTVTSGALASSVTQTGMASGGTVNLTLNHNELYRWNHQWKDSGGNAVSGVSNFSFLLVE